MIENLEIYLPIDRCHALAQGTTIPDSMHGAVLFVDASGFTALTQKLVQTYGSSQGAEEIARHLNQVFEALITEVNRFGGSVINFSGDALTCWFAEDDGHRITACGLKMQQAMEVISVVPIPHQDPVILSVKVVGMAGTVRRFQVGDPAIQLMDVIAGDVLVQLAALEQHTHPGEVVLDRATAQALADDVQIKTWRQYGEDAYAVVEQIVAVPVSAGATLPVIALHEEQVRPWLLKAVYDRICSGQGDFLAELRPVVALFVRFMGIDYENAGAGAQLDTYIRWVQIVLQRYEGSLINLTIGDKGSYLYCSFGAPIAHDDDVIRAASAALELRSPPAQAPFIQSVQVSMSSGRMWAGAYGSSIRRTYDVLGNDVNLAARLMQQAHPGQIVVSQQVAKALATRYHLNPLGKTRVKGIPTAIDIFELVGAKSTANPLPSQLLSDLPQIQAQTPIVGRIAERSLFTQKLQALQQGQSNVLVLEGEAGIGKSRLMEHLLAQAGELSIANGFCAGNSIEQTTPYHAWRLLFYRLVREDILVATGESRYPLVIQWLRHLLEANQAEIAPADAERLLSFAPLLSIVLPFQLPENEITQALQGPQRAQATCQFLAELLRLAFRSQPFLLVIEDAHWLDSSSWALVHQVVETVAPLLLVLTTRPMFQASQPQLQRLLHLDFAHRIPLQSMAGDHILAMLHQRLGVNALPEKVTTFIQRKAEGNPFFSEELLYALQDANVLTLVQGACVLNPQAPELEVLDFPDTIQGLVTSRIDRLTPSQQLTIKVSSVIGQVFAFRTLREIYPVSQEVSQLMDHLTILSRLDLTPLASPEPKLQYAFKHVITQEAAYRLMLQTQRRLLHRQLAEWYERTCKDDLATYYPVLAYHWTAVAQAAPDDLHAARCAITYHHHTAEQAVQLGSYQEAFAHLDLAFPLVETLPPDSDRWHHELALQVTRGVALIVTKGQTAPETYQAYEQARILAGRVVDTQQLGQVLFGLWAFYFFQGDLKKASDLAYQCLEIAQQQRDDNLQIETHLMLGNTTFWMGYWEENRSHSQQLIKLYDPQRHGRHATQFAQNPRITCLICSWATWIMGYPTQALAQAEEALALAQEEENDFILAIAYQIMAIVHHHRRDIASTQRYAETLFALSQNRFPIYHALALALQGWAQAAQGDRDTSIALIQQGISLWQNAGMQLAMTLYNMLLADGYLMTGQHAEGLALLDTYLDTLDQERAYEAELYRLKGELLKSTDPQAAAIAFERSLSIAQQQKAISWQLRTALSLYQLDFSTTHLDLIKTLYNQFTEGFDTTDLKLAAQLMAASQSRQSS